MAGHQVAAGALKAALDLRSERLTEKDYVNLIEQGFDTPEALLDARDKSLEAILGCKGAVDAVLAWQAESKPQQHLGRWQCCHESLSLSRNFACRHSSRLVGLPMEKPLTLSACIRYCLSGSLAAITSSKTAV